MFPMPLAAKPIDAVLFVHVYETVEPLAGLLNVTALVNVLAHTT